MKPFEDSDVAEAFSAYPPPVRRRLLALRALIFKTAASIEGVGSIEEALRWGEPAYLTSESGSGSTIRLGWKQARPTEYAMYFNCQTSLVGMFRRHFPTELTFEGNRAVLFDVSHALPAEAAAFCIAAALTYHETKHTASGKRSSCLAFRSDSR